MTEEMEGTDMEIAMLTNNYLPFIGGVPISIERLSGGLKELGHEVTIFAPQYEKEEENPEVFRYHSFPLHLKNGMVIPNVFDWRIERQFAAGYFDVIHVHQPMGIGNVAVHLSRKYEIPLVFTYHTQYEEYLHYLKLSISVRERCRKKIPEYMDYFMKQCDLVFAPSEDIKKYLDRRSTGAEIRVLPTGLSAQAFTEEKETGEKIRAEYQGDAKYLLCTVSRIEKEKNLYFLVDSMVSLKQRMGEKFRLMIVGDGGEKKALERYVKSRGMEKSIIFTGTVCNDKVAGYLSASDAFIFASKSETQGIVLLEAMAAGLPVVAVKACGVKDIVRNGENGFMLPENREAFAEVTRKVLEDEVLKKCLKDGAKESVKKYQAIEIAKKAQAGYEYAVYGEGRENLLGEYGYEKKHRRADTVPSLLHVFKAS